MYFLVEYSTEQYMHGQTTVLYSTVKHMQHMWQENMNTHIESSHEPVSSMTQKEIKLAKRAMRKSVVHETLHKWNNKVKNLTLQGDFVKLVFEYGKYVIWKIISNNIPKGVLSFALKAATNGLNTHDNLKRWGIRKTNKCDLCGKLE